MGLKRRMVAGLAAGALLLGVAVSGLATAAPVPAGATPAKQRGTPRTVTLITGDRVTVGPDARRPLVQRGQGRGAVPFFIRRQGGHWLVLPGDALGLVTTGRLDRRLFDVTGLLADGYGDAARADVPVIVQYQRPVAGRRLAVAGATAQRELPVVRGLALHQAKQDAPKLWSSVTRKATASSPVGGAAAARRLAAGIAHVWLDSQYKLALDRSVPQIGAPAAWQAGLIGEGVNVAVLDSGVDAGHPDLAGRIAAYRNFITDEQPGDDSGHGTHVAATIAGSGAGSAGRYRGVAPGARLLIGDVCGESGKCDLSAILAAMAWAAEEQGARIVNMSIGSAGMAEEEDPVEQAVRTLSAEHHTLFVTSAGNQGPRAATVGSPASAPAALAVGAVDRDDTPAGFSSRGPAGLDGAVKPDLTAPGVGIVAARAQGTSLGEPVDDRYTAVSGTSMSAPHVAGAAAILAQQHPDWTGEQLKAALLASAAPAPGVSAFTQGAGRVDVARAISQTLTATPASVTLGLQPWPHSDDQPVTRALTYRNAGPDPVSLDLTIGNATGPDNTPAPAGMFSVEPARVTVPASGQAQVTVTGDTNGTTTAGAYGAQLIATGTTTRVSVPLGIAAEAESYDLTLRHLGRDGEPAGAYGTLFADLDDADCTFCSGYLSGPDTTVTVRLPKGDYLLDSAVTTSGATDENRLVQPLVRLDHDTSIVLDARVAKPFDITVPQQSAKLFTFSYDYVRYVHENNDNFDGAFIVERPPSVPISAFRTAHLGPTLAHGLLESNVYAAYAQPGRHGDFADSPIVVNLAWTLRGQVFSGLVRHVQPGQLAAVRSSYLATATNRTGQKYVVALTDGGFGVYPREVPWFRLPFTRTEYYLAEGHTWDERFYQYAPDFQSVEYAQLKQERVYQPGNYQEQWAGGVIGPRFPNDPLGEDFGVRRQGDRLQAGIAMFSDSIPGHFSRTPGTAPGRTALYRDGVLIEESPSCCYLFASSLQGYVSLPPEPATYRLDIDGDYGFSTVSPRVTGSWTFRSGHVDGDEFVALPLMAVRYTPRLDDRQRAPAGERFQVPVTVEGHFGAPPTEVRSLTVEVSVDDGATWRQAPLTRQGAGWVATIRNPNQGYVSLRAKATNDHASTVDQTIIRAYAISST